jgi:tungstate transport system ATP-binding protein
MSELLSIRHLQKRFGSRLLLDIEQLVIESATAYVLTGMNGVGKSVLLRILAGFEPLQPTPQVRFLGQPLPLWPYPQAMRKAIGYVHQHPLLFSGSVEQNIAWGLHAQHLPPREIAGRVEQAMLWAGITHLRQRRAQGLSGGEIQRIALARAKVLQPRLLLLDEPTANLDGAAREQVMALIPDMLAEGSSVVMACHDRDLIAVPGVRHWKLREGRLQERAPRVPAPNNFPPQE